MKKIVFFAGPTARCFAALIMAAVVLFLAGPPALARVVPYDGDIAEVKGLWLDVPGFPRAEFAEDGAKRREGDDEYGYFSFRRGLGGDNWVDNRWELVVDRYRHTDETVPGGESFYPVTAEKAKAFLVGHGAVPEEAGVEISADETASAHLTYPVFRTRSDFKTGNGVALSSFGVFVFTDSYLFWINLTAPAAAAGKFTENDFKAWFESMEFRSKDAGGPDEEVRELMLEAPAYPGRARVIEQTRYIDTMAFKIKRYNAKDGWGPKTPEEVPGYIQELVQNGNGQMDLIKSDPEWDARTSRHFGRPCVLVEYTEGANEDTSFVNRLFMFVDEYVFDVEITTAADDYEEYSPVTADWLARLKLVERRAGRPN